MAITQSDIENEVLGFYGNLMGRKYENLRSIDMSVMKLGPQLSRVQSDGLISPVKEEEIFSALKGIHDLSAPGLDGFNSRLFKHYWDIIKGDLTAAVHEFFDKGYLYKAFNCIVVSLIPKSKSSRSIRDYGPIYVCTIVCKIISRILTARLGHVICKIVSPNQATFIPGKQTHSHILLVFKLINGYNRNSGPPRCMVQLDMQKAYDMISWKAL